MPVNNTWENQQNYLRELPIPRSNLQEAGTSSPAAQ